MEFKLHHGDLPDGLTFPDSIAVDTETLGLEPHRDRLCVVQLSGGDGIAHLVKFERDQFDAPNLCRLLSDPRTTKIFHFARFDLAVIRHYLGVTCAPVYCTRTASKLVRTFTDKHGLRDLCQEMLGIEISKQQQSSYWGAEKLSEDQLRYAAYDVLYLHDLRGKLEQMLEREGRKELARACFNFLPYIAELDLAGWSEAELFSH